MNILNQLLNEAEKRINNKLARVRKQIDFNPFEESSKINQDLKEYLMAPVSNIEQLNELQRRTHKNNRDIERYLKSGYLEMLIKKESRLEEQHRELSRLKRHISQ